MKWIRFVMSRGEDIIVNESEAKRILEAPDQLMPIKQAGEWQGQTINKAHIVQTIEDFEFYAAEERKKWLAPQYKKPSPEFLKNWTQELKAKMKWL